MGGAAGDIARKAVQGAVAQFTRESPERKAAARGVSKVAGSLRARGHSADIDAAPDRHDGAAGVDSRAPK